MPLPGGAFGMRIYPPRRSDRSGSCSGNGAAPGNLRKQTVLQILEIVRAPGTTVFGAAGSGAIAIAGQNHTVDLYLTQRA